MLSLKQRLAIRLATRLLRAADVPVWFDIRAIFDTKKDLFGTRMGSKRSTPELLLDQLPRIASAMPPEMRLDVRMYGTLATTRGAFIAAPQQGGHAISSEPRAPADVKVGTATTWHPSAHLKGQARAMIGQVRARASGVALPPAEPPPAPESWQGDTDAPDALKPDSPIIPNQGDPSK